jgi:hypothetical protein
MDSSIPPLKNAWTILYGNKPEGLQEGQSDGMLLMKAIEEACRQR